MVKCFAQGHIDRLFTLSARVCVLSPSEQCIEAYELLLTLAESEQSLVLGQFRAAGVGDVGE